MENFTVLDEENRIRYHYIVTYLIARHADGEARPGMEVADVRWVTREELDNLDMNPVVRKNMSDAFDIVCPAD